MGNKATVTKRSDNFLNLGCNFCFISNTGQLIQIERGGKKQLANQCVNCGNITNVEMTTKQGNISNDPADFDFQDKPSEKLIKEVKSEQYRTFPLSRKLAHIQ